MRRLSNLAVVCGAVAGLVATPVHAQPQPPQQRQGPPARPAPAPARPAEAAQAPAAPAPVPAPVPMPAPAPAPAAVIPPPSWLPHSLWVAGPNTATVVAGLGAVAGVVAFNTAALGVGALPGGATLLGSSMIPAEMAVAVSRVYAVSSAVVGAWIGDFLYHPDPPEGGTESGRLWAMAAGARPRWNASRPRAFCVICCASCRPRVAQTFF